MVVGLIIWLTVFRVQIVARLITDERRHSYTQSGQQRAAEYFVELEVPSAAAAACTVVIIDADGGTLQSV